MTRLDVEIDPKLDSRFRSQVFKRLGMKRGNLSKSVEDALKLWLRYDGRRELSTHTPTPKAKQPTPELIASAPAG
ncbi:MAG: hypothetical protein WA364_22345 [Candidatus Nitrosopolaris sp.]